MTKDQLTIAIKLKADIIVQKTIIKFRKDVKIACSNFVKITGTPLVSSFTKYPVNRDWGDFNGIEQLLISTLVLQPSDEPYRRAWPKEIWTYVERQISEEILKKTHLFQSLLDFKEETFESVEKPNEN